jgi:hypothetical protein
MKGVNMPKGRPRLFDKPTKHILLMVEEAMYEDTVQIAGARSKVQWQWREWIRQAIDRSKQEAAPKDAIAL